ncbi:hypothetical protein ACFYP4_15685 [Streptomyces sp. NPDC005551]|uniref:hypothetical protein n=1 Tax=unclassified Streptomyces TaxID=2593676 RepID=UPI00340085A4
MMGHRYYLYGSGQMSLSEVCDALSVSLGASFESRHSDFKGGRYYLLRDQAFGKITVEENWEDEEGYLAEPEFPEYPTLAYVSEPTARTLSTLETAGYLRRLRVSCIE